MVNDDTEHDLAVRIKSLEEKLGKYESHLNGEWDKMREAVAELQASSVAGEWSLFGKSISIGAATIISFLFALLIASGGWALIEWQRPASKIEPLVVRVTAIEALDKTTIELSRSTAMAVHRLTEALDNFIRRYELAGTRVGAEEVLMVAQCVSQNFSMHARSQPAGKEEAAVCERRMQVLENLLATRILSDSEIRRDSGFNNR